MKKIILSLVCLCFVTLAWAQKKPISMYVYIPEQSETIPQSCMDYLSNSLTTAITTDGLAAQSEYLTPFLLVPKVNIATKNTLATTQQQVVLTLDVNLQVVDNTSGTVFASTIINLKGVGTNEIKAYNAAFRSINKSNAKIREFVSNAKAKIIAYYEKEGDNIIQKHCILPSSTSMKRRFIFSAPCLPNTVNMTMPSQPAWRFGETIKTSRVPKNWKRLVLYGQPIRIWTRQTWQENVFQRSFQIAIAMVPHKHCTRTSRERWVNSGNTR